MDASGGFPTLSHRQSRLSLSAESDGVCYSLRRAAHFQDAARRGRTIWQAARGIRACAAMAQYRKKILCIEDDDETARLIATELAGRGFDVIVAHDGQEGFVSILKGIPDLVLCDVSVPIMSGFELLERLIELAPRLGALPPFIFLTALSDRDSELRARRLGADDYIAKPIDFDILETIVRARLAGVARIEVRPKRADLNDRETEVLTWVARGKTSAQIAEMLGLAKRTIDFHLDNARNKLGASTRTEAVIKAAFGRLIEP
jgi:DNA-binding NarL/FixJ family response regulator